MKKRFILIVGALAVLLLVLGTSSESARAATTLGGDEVTIEADQTVEGNLYLAGDTVAIEGRVTGDLIAVGRSIRLGENAEVGGDLLCAAANIYIQGELVGDLRCAAYTIEIQDGGRIGGEVTTAAFGLHLEEGGRMEGEVLATGAQAVLSGELGNDLNFAGAALEINGKVDGDVQANVAGRSEGKLEDQAAFTSMMPNAPKAPPEYAEMGLTIGPDALVSGDLNYESPEEADVPDTGVQGAISFDEVFRDGGQRSAEPADSPFVAWLKSFFASFLALLIFGSILLMATPRLLNRGQATIASQALPSAGWGLLTVVVAFAGVFVLFLGTLIGLILFSQIGLPGLLEPLLATSALTFVGLTMGTVLLGWVGRAVVGYFLGRWILDRSGESMLQPFIALLIGTAILALLTSIPWAGGIFATVATLTGLGAVVGHLLRLLSALRSDASMMSAAD